MNGPKLAAVLVALVMAGGFGYISWTSRQVANANSSDEALTPAGRTDRMMEEMQSQTPGRSNGGGRR